MKRNIGQPFSEGFEFAHSKRVIEAPQFVQYVFDNAGAEVLNSSGRITTSLDGRVQAKSPANPLEPSRGAEVKRRGRWGGARR